LRAGAGKFSRENRGSFLAIYITRVRVTVRAQGAPATQNTSMSADGPNRALGASKLPKESDRRAYCAPSLLFPGLGRG
jgi:hypothetical protein